MSAGTYAVSQAGFRPHQARCGRGEAGFSSARRTVVSARSKCASFWRVETSLVERTYVVDSITTLAATNTLPQPREVTKKSKRCGSSPRSFFARRA